MTDAKSGAGTFAGDDASLPLPEREKEFNTILQFLQRRWTRKNNASSLFIYGACGSGKTSTVLRSLRLCSDKPIPGDWTSACTPATKPQLLLSTSDHNTGSPLMKRLRHEDDDDDGSRSSGRLSSASSTCAASPRSSFGTTAALSSSADIEFKRSSWTAQFPQLTVRKTGKLRMFAHYINCADLTGVQLCDAIISSIKSVCPRPDAWSRELIEVLEALPLAASKRPPRESLESRMKAAAPLHVIVIDEVEFLRSSGTKAMMELATYAAVNCEVVLIFISNQRHLVHVPQMLREELGFEAYTSTQLKEIARRMTDYGLSEAVPDESARQKVKVSPVLYEYIARKALLEFSGDARQVAAMCRRVVFASVDQLPKAADLPSPPVGQRRKRMPPQDDAASSQLLKTVIDSYADTEKSPKGRLSQEKESTPAAAATTPPSTPTTTLSLASSVKLLRSCVVEEEADRYIMSMTEQMAYVLSCLVVLRLAAQRDEQRRQTSIGGVLPGRRSAAAVQGSRNSISLRELNTLYATLMSRRHFPSMNPSGIASTVDGLADLSIITRPQRRGNEHLFSFNGTWRLESMEAALKARGEAARAEMISLGLDGSENRFVSVFNELKQIVNL